MVLSEVVSFVFGAWLPIYLKLLVLLFDSYPKPIEIPWAVELSVFSGVGGCGCPIVLMHACRIGMSFWALMNDALSSASAAAAITSLMRVFSIWIAPFILMI